MTGKILDNENIERYQIEARWNKWAKILKVGEETKSKEIIWNVNELP